MKHKTTMKHESTFRYQLGRLRGRCPQCGRKTFKFYVDTATGDVLNENCGRCNREIKCGYHSAPSEYTTEELTKYRVIVPRQMKPYEPSFIPPEVTVQSPARLDKNDLFCFLADRFGADLVREQFCRYNVTHARFYGGSTAFWLRDSQGRFRSAKVMAYDRATGRRIKRADGASSISWAHSLMKLKEFNFSACFFGEHLAAQHPEATLLMVESEKTALILNIELTRRGMADRYLAMACGGASLLCSDLRVVVDDCYNRGRVLLGRRVVLLPDADMVERWQGTLPSLRILAGEVKLVDTRLPPLQLSGSEDIGDYILKSVISEPSEPSELSD